MKSGWKNWEIKEILKDDKNFPSGLKQIVDCPEKLYYRGNWETNLFSKSLAVVGSRRMTRYGKEVIDKFMPDLVSNNVTIVSGFMYGIDSQAHKTCLELGGKTIAVLGSGLNYLTPVENDDLYSKILEKGGLMVSEYESNFKPTIWSFPRRNRIVCGISTLGILVIEAGIKSGSLITARIGKKQNKNVFAVPGPINSSVSAGTNWLLEQGLAKIVICPFDILGKSDEPKQMDLLDKSIVNREFRKILETLRREPMTVDELAREMGKEIPEISIVLSQMMLEGIVEDSGGRLYALQV